MKKQIIFLSGPTASGKSEAATFLAKKIGGEVISCDSMQVYKGMEILTSSAAPSLRKKIRHHLISFVNPTKEYNVSQYRQDALRAMREVLARGNTPIFAGGTGLYMSILLDGIFKAKKIGPAIREKLYEDAQALGNYFLYERLKKIDPQAAAKIHINDLRRIVRALEVFESQGCPISELQRQRQGLAEKYDCRIFCLSLEKEELYRRIALRVEKMFKSGLINEVKRLLKLKLSPTAGLAIGLRELGGHLRKGYDLETAKALIIKNTRRYAKRQLTWFRKDKRIRWIEIKNNDSPKKVAGIIMKNLAAVSYALIKWKELS